MSAPAKTEASVADKLRAIADEITEHPERWTQGSDGRDGVGSAVPALSDQAVCWCTSGLLQRDFRGSDYETARASLIRALGAEDGYEILGWNDEHSRRPAEVVAVLRRAADLAEQSQ